MNLSLVKEALQLLEVRGEACATEKIQRALYRVAAAARCEARQRIRGRGGRQGGRFGLRVRQRCAGQSDRERCALRILCVEKLKYSLSRYVITITITATAAAIYSLSVQRLTEENKIFEIR